MIALVASVVLVATPFAPLPAPLLASPDLREALRGGDLVVARPGDAGRSRSFTGLALVQRPCDEVYRLLRDPLQHPKVYPMVERVRVLRREGDRTEFEIAITAGPGSSTRALRTRELPGRVLHTEQEAGASTWHFVEAGPRACVLHFTHDEDFTADSMVLRMAMKGKEPILEGIQSAAAVGNVRNVRLHFEPGSAAVEVAAAAVDRTLLQLSGVGTTAFLSHRDGAPVLVGTRVRQAAGEVLETARRSERWKAAIPMFYAVRQAPAENRARRLRYHLSSMFEDVDFETVQRHVDDHVDERVAGGDLQSGGWTWRVAEAAPDRALLLAFRLRIEEGDWLVSQITRFDRSAQEGTVLGIAFMLVDRVAALADQAPTSRPRSP